MFLLDEINPLISLGPAAAIIGLLVAVLLIVIILIVRKLFR